MFKKLKIITKNILYVLLFAFLFYQPFYFFWKHVLFPYWGYFALLFLLLSIWLFAKRLSRNIKQFFNRISLVLFKKIKIKKYTKKLDSKKIQPFHNFIKADNHLQKLIFEILNNHFKNNQDILNKNDDILSILKLLSADNVKYYFSSKSRIELEEKFIDFVNAYLISNLKINVFTLDLDLKNSFSKFYIERFYKDVINGHINLRVSNPNQITVLFESYELRDLYYDEANKPIKQPENIPLLFKCMIDNDFFDIVKYLPKRFVNKNILTDSELLKIENDRKHYEDFNLFHCFRYCFSYFDTEYNERKECIKLTEKNLEDKLNFYIPFNFRQSSVFSENLNVHSILTNNRKHEKEFYNFFKRKNFYNILRLLLSINYLEITKRNINDDSYQPKSILSIYRNLSNESLFFNLNPYYSFNYILKSNNFNYSELLLSDIFCQEYSNKNQSNFKEHSNDFIYPHEFFNLISKWSYYEYCKRKLIIINGKEIFEERYFRNLSIYAKLLIKKIDDVKLINYIAKNFTSFKESFYDRNIVINYFEQFTILHKSINLISNELESDYHRDALEYFISQILNKIPEIYFYLKDEFKIKYAEQAVLKDEENFKLLPDGLKNDSLFFRKILKQKGYLYSYLPSEMKTDKSLILGLIQDNYEVIDYLDNYSELRDLIIIEVFNNIKLLNSNRVKKEFEDINLLNDLIVKTNEFEYIFNFIPEHLLVDNFYLNIINNTDLNIFDNNIKFEILERKDFIVKIINIKGLKYLRKFSYKISNDILEEIYFEYLITQFFGIKSLESVIHFNSKENFKRVRVFEICFTNLLEKSNINFVLTSILNEKQSFIKFQDILNCDFYILEIKDEIISMKREVLNQNKVNLILFREKFDFENNLETEIKIAQNIFFRVLSIDTIELKKYVLNSENGIINIDLQFLNF